MAKLNKMELTALATKMVKDLNALSLPILLAKWEEKEREVENLPVYLEYKAYLERYPELFVPGNSMGTLLTLKHKLGLSSKPGIYSSSKITIEDVINSLVIAQITDDNMVNVIEQVKQSFLNTINN